MQTYLAFDIAKTTELTVVKNGLFNPSYELTDGAYSYGKLYFKGWLRRTAFIDTATESWTLRQKNWYCNNVDVINQNGEIVATTKTSKWKGKVTLIFTDGQELKYNSNGMFSQKFSWFNEPYGNLVNFKVKSFSNKKPFIISFEPTMAKSDANPILLSFLGINIILIRNAQMAAAT